MYCSMLNDSHTMHIYYSAINPLILVITAKPFWQNIMHIYWYKFLQQPIHEATQIGQNLHLTQGKNTIFFIQFGYIHVNIFFST